MGFLPHVGTPDQWRKEDDKKMLLRGANSFFQSISLLISPLLASITENFEEIPNLYELRTFLFFPYRLRFESSHFNQVAQGGRLCVHRAGDPS